MSPVIYSYPNNPRVAKSKIVASLSGVSVEDAAEFQMGVTNKTDDYLSKVVSGTVPGLIDGDFGLFESNAIAFYLAKKKPGNTLLGSNTEEEAQILQWLEFECGTYSMAVGFWVYPVLGYMPFRREMYERAKTMTHRALGMLERQLTKGDYLVGNRLTLADVVIACALKMPMSMVLSPEHRAPYPHVVKYFERLTAMDAFKQVLGEVTLCTEEAKAKDHVEPTLDTSGEC